MDQNIFNQIALTLARHFDSAYYVEIETGNYVEFVSSHVLEGIGIPKQGEDFFTFSSEHANLVIHPDDLDYFLKNHEKSVIMKNLSESYSYSFDCRLILNGDVLHIRHLDIMCEDNKHIICCMENIEDEYREKEEQKKNLQSAERLARRDELTGIKNKTAFAEKKSLIDEKLKEASSDYHFGVVMCDINDLKLINDTRGHSVGDEAIRRTSHMICDVYKHSPVYRIGGDEFVVILEGNDYEQRDALLTVLKQKSEKHARLRSGPVVACGMAIYEAGTDKDFDAVFMRADSLMYENKQVLKNGKAREGIKESAETKIPIPDDRKQILDRLFGALITVSGGGYIYLNDLRYDFSRWSLALVDDFNMPSEYMYHAGKIWQKNLHPDDRDKIQTAVDEVLFEGKGLKPIYYRAQKADGTYVVLYTRGFVLNDSNGEPEYFGGIIIQDT